MIAMVVPNLLDIKNGQLFANKVALYCHKYACEVKLFEAQVKKFK